jgi:hypothetical protein
MRRRNEGLGNGEGQLSVSEEQSKNSEDNSNKERELCSQISEQLSRTQIAIKKFNLNNFGETISDSIFNISINEVSYYRGQFYAYFFKEGGIISIPIPEDFFKGNKEKQKEIIDKLIMIALSR